MDARLRPALGFSQNIGLGGHLLCAWSWCGLSGWCGFSCAVAGRMRKAHYVCTVAAGRYFCEESESYQFADRQGGGLIRDCGLVEVR